MLDEINFADIYVSITVSLLQQINICWCRNNCQYSMPAHPEFKNIPMENYKREILLTFMLADCLYVTHSLNLANVEVISNIQC